MPSELQWLPERFRLGFCTNLFHSEQSDDAGGQRDAQYCPVPSRKRLDVQFLLSRMSSLAGRFYARLREELTVWSQENMISQSLAANTTVIVWGGLLILVAGLALLTYFLKKRREDVWKSFARKHHCRYEMTEEGPRVSGNYSGHPFVLLIPPDSSDTGIMAVEEVRLVMTFDDLKLPSDIQIHSATGFVGELQRSLEAHQVSFEDDELFDQNLVVTSEDPQAAQRCLSPHCREVLLNLVKLHPEANLGIRSGEASIQIRSAISEKSQLENMLESLSQVVHSISTAS